MKEQFVTYEIALKLKEKGFKQPKSEVEISINHYFSNKGVISSYQHFSMNDVEKFNKKLDWTIYAPLWQQVIDWLRKEHNLRVFESTPIAGLSSKSFNEDFRFELVKISGNGGRANSVYGNGGLGSRYQTYSSYDEARQAVIEKALTLI